MIRRSSHSRKEGSSNSNQEVSEQAGVVNRKGCVCSVVHMCSCACARVKKYLQAWLSKCGMEEASFRFSTFACAVGDRADFGSAIAGSTPFAKSVFRQLR